MKLYMGYEWFKRPDAREIEIEIASGRFVKAFGRPQC